MVAGHFPERAQCLVQGLLGGPGRPVAGAGAAICRLRGVAEAADRRREAAAAGRVLERSAGGSAGAVGVAVGPCAAGAAELQRKVEPNRAGRDLINGAERVKPAAWSNVVHDIAGRVGGPDGTVMGAGGGGDWDTGGQPRQGGDREADRIFREHVGGASECFRGTNSGETAGANEKAGSCCPAASGHSLRAGCGTSESAAESVAHAIVQREVCVAKRGGREARVSGSRDRSFAGGIGEGQV